MNSRIRIKALLGSVLLAFVLVACKSSDRDGPSPDTPININTDGNTVLTGPTPYVNTDANGELQGYIWSAKTGSRLNLETGEISYVSEGHVFPRADGREYAELFTDFRNYSEAGCGGWPMKSHAVFIRDTATNKVTQSIEVFAKLAGPVYLSPNGERLALFATSDDVCGDQNNYYVTVMARDGTVLTTASERVVGFDWMPDNRIVYMVLRDGEYSLVVETEPDTLTGSFLATLDDMGGSASRFRISPDGSQILIEVVTDVAPVLASLEYRDATVWQADIDGSNLRKLVDTSRISSFDDTQFETPRVNAPVWSPDGSHMLVTEDYLLGAAVSYYGTETENLTYIESVSINAISNDSVTYVMPTDSEPQRLPPTNYSTTGVRPLFGLDSSGKNGILGINPIGRQFWTPSITLSESVGTGFPAPNGQINRGLGGVLYEATDRDDNMNGIPIKATDLASGNKGVVRLDIDDGSTSVSGFDVSLSQERIAALHLDSALVNTYDANGSLLESYSQTTSNYDYEAQGRIQISPVDEDIVAWVFGSRFSSIGGIVVLDTGSAQFVKTFDDKDYDTFAFMPNGDLLMTSDNKLYLARQDVTGFATPLLAFEHNDYLEELAVHPEGDRLAFSSRGRIFTIDPDGSNVRTVTAPSNYFYKHPVWSPDGKTLGFSGTHADVSGRVANYFVAADAQNVALFDGYIQNDIMRLGESSSATPPELEQVIWR